jgi:hypothetical protein
MKPEEMICLAVLQQDVEQGLHDALAPSQHAFQREHGTETTKAYLERLQKITQGKSAAVVVERFLRNHGIAHQARAGKRKQHEFDLRIKNEKIRLKSFAVPEKYAKAEFVVNALALVPADEWLKRNNFHRYIFVYFAGKLRLTLQQSLSVLLSARRPPKRDEIVLKSGNVRLFLTAAPAISECEKRFKKIRAKTRCVQFPRGTRVDCMGCRVAELTAFKRVVQWGGV